MESDLGVRGGWRIVGLLSLGWSWDLCHLIVSTGRFDEIQFLDIYTCEGAVLDFT